MKKDAILLVAGSTIAMAAPVAAQDNSPFTGPRVEVVGDSLGEMTAYIAASDRVLVGGGFTPKGAHNIIEALAQGKPVLVGPETWTIEYPAEEAIAAGICRRVEAGDLTEALLAPTPDGLEDRIEGFLREHSGAVDKTLDALPGLLFRA